MNGDNFRMVDHETAAQVLQQHFARMSIPRRLDMRGRHGKQRSLSPEAREHLREVQLKSFCDRNGITDSERQAYVALIEKTGLRAAEAMAMIKAERKA